jgi:hypothetical protein
MLGLVGDRLRKFAADRRADDVSFGLLVRIALTSLSLIPIWWVVRAAVDMATLNPNIADIFLGAAGIALIFLLPRYLSDLWRPTHLSRKQAMEQRTRDNRLELLLQDPPNDPPPVPPTRW